MKRLLSALKTALPPVIRMGQGVLLLCHGGAAPAVAEAIIRRENDLPLQVLPAPLQAGGLPVSDQLGALLLAGDQFCPDFLALTEDLAAAFPDLPLLVALARMPECAESDLILAGAVECLALPGPGEAHLVRALRRAMLRHRRAQETRRQSEAALQTVRFNLDQAQRIGHVGIWEWDVLSGELWLSDEALRILGLPSRSGGTITYQQLLDAVPAEDRAAVEAAMDCSLTSLSGYHVEHRTRWRDGSIHTVRQQGEVACDENGLPTRMVGTLLDITRRRQVEKALSAAQEQLERRVRDRTRALLREVAQRQRAESVLRESEQRIRTIADALPGLIAYIDHGRRFQFANRQHQDWLGLAPEGMVGKTAAEVLPEEMLALMRPHLSEVLAGHEVSYGGWITAHNGERRAIQATHLPHRAADGEVLGFFSLVLDVTVSRLAEQQLRAAKEAAELADRAKSEFLANMSHELRTPLNAIIGFSDVMRAEVMGPLGNDAYRGYAGDIHDSGQHLLSVINEILDMSKVEAGQVELFPEEVVLPDLARQTLPLLRERAEQAKVRLLNALDEDLPPLLVDARRFKQIVLNLLSNAVKFTLPGGTVRLWAELEADGTLTLSVSDDGIGMDADGMAKAFRPFAQVDGSLARRFDGTGLGLPLTKAFIELHGGRLELISAIGHGTIARVHVPAERVLRLREKAEV